MAVVSTIACVPKQDLPYPKLRKMLRHSDGSRLAGPVIVLCNNHGKATVVYSQDSSYEIGIVFTIKSNEAEDWGGTIAISNRPEA